MRGIHTRLPSAPRRCSTGRRKGNDSRSLQEGHDTFRDRVVAEQSTLILPSDTSVGLGSPKIYKKVYPSAWHSHPSFPTTWHWHTAVPKSKDMNTASLSSP